jgi:hypothetical protein
MLNAMNERGQYGSHQPKPLELPKDPKPWPPAPCFKVPKDPNPIVWLITAVIGAAAVDKKHRVLGFLGGGVIGIGVDAAVRRIT